MLARTPKHVDLYHGTSAGNARRIAADGFRPVDAHALVTKVARSSGVATDLLWNRMRHAWGTDRIGDLRVYFTTHPERAASYARRGSEVAHFALRSAFAILNADDPNSNAAQEWAKQQAARADDPAIVHLRAPVRELPEREVARALAWREVGEEITSRCAFEVLLTAPIPRDWPLRVGVAAPCTCWRDGRGCPACTSSHRATTLDLSEPAPGTVSWP